MMLTLLKSASISSLCTPALSVIMTTYPLECEQIFAEDEISLLNESNEGLVYNFDFSENRKKSLDQGYWPERFIIHICRFVSFYGGC